MARFYEIFILFSRSKADLILADAKNGKFNSFGDDSPQWQIFMS